MLKNRILSSKKSLLVYSYTKSLYVALDKLKTSKKQHKKTKAITKKQFFLKNLKKHQKTLKTNFPIYGRRAK